MTYGFEHQFDKKNLKNVAFGCKPAFPPQKPALIDPLPTLTQTTPAQPSPSHPASHRTAAAQTHSYASAKSPSPYTASHAGPRCSPDPSRSCTDAHPPSRRGCTLS